MPEPLETIPLIFPLPEHVCESVPLPVLLALIPALTEKIPVLLLVRPSDAIAVILATKIEPGQVTVCADVTHEFIVMLLGLPIAGPLPSPICGEG